MHNAKDIDVVMPMHNQIKHSDKYSRIWKFYVYFIEINWLMLMVLLLNFVDDNATDSFEFFKKTR